MRVGTAGKLAVHEYLYEPDAVKGSVTGQMRDATLLVLQTEFLSATSPNVRIIGRKAGCIVVSSAAPLLARSKQGDKRQCPATRPTAVPVIAILHSEGHWLIVL